MNLQMRVLIRTFPSATPAAFFGGGQKRGIDSGESDQTPRTSDRPMNKGRTSRVIPAVRRTLLYSIAVAICLWLGSGAGLAAERSADEAAAEMKRYRDNLNHNYSDIMGLGDDGVWTEVNGTFTARKGNIILQVLQPSEKMKQIHLGKAVIDKL